MAIKRQQRRRRCKHPEWHVLLAEHGTEGERRQDSRRGGEGWREEGQFFLGLPPHLQTLLLPLGASVLEPDLHLRLREAEGGGDGVALQHRQVVAPVETVLQDPQLF